ncbi:hypothetical protein [Oryza sativa Japonica Group]|uniref:Uncharacterized protein n=2 Tax=Oryza sativa subsp. japonica TaxID=39947 RepID=Q5QMX5_ORYSJ|nr:hypothetical protein [Oryza sativa Japonica Group]BAD73569.1 hypothetical protein [Oryza sativa Japonica Group]
MRLAAAAIPRPPSGQIWEGRGGELCREPPPPAIPPATRLAIAALPWPPSGRTGRGGEGMGAVPGAAAAAPRVVVTTPHPAGHAPHHRSPPPASLRPDLGESASGEADVAVHAAAITTSTPSVLPRSLPLRRGGREGRRAEGDGPVRFLQADHIRFVCENRFSQAPLK